MIIAKDGEGEPIFFPLLKLISTPYDPNLGLEFI